MPPGDKEIKAMVRQDGTYPSLPLKKDTINVSIAQTRVNGVDGKISSLIGRIQSIKQFCNNFPKERQKITQILMKYFLEK